MKGCQFFEDRFSAYLERDLSAVEVEAFLSHVDGCARCGASLKALGASQAALLSGAPKGPRVGPSFTRQVMARVRSARREAAGQAAPRPFRRRWAALAAAVLLVGLGLKAGISALLATAPPASGGFRVIKAQSHREEPYVPGAVLEPGDIVVAGRGGRIPVGGRIVGIGPGGIMWVPGNPLREDQVPAPREARPASGGEGLVLAFSDERCVQVLSGSAGIAWRATPTHRRRYLHELVDLAEGRDPQASVLARDEIRRLLGGGYDAADPSGAWRALAQADGRGQDGRGYAMLPVVERSAEALGGPAQNLNLSAVSRALGKTLTLVGDRYLPAPMARLLNRQEGG